MYSKILKTGTPKTKVKKTAPAMTPAKAKKEEPLKHYGSMAAALGKTL